MPATATVIAGRPSASFPIRTAPSVSTAAVTITAAFNGELSAALALLPGRGAPGDLIADVVLGKPDFGEVTPNEVLATRLFNPGGVLVDRSVKPNRVYVYDGGNSRVLGMSHLGFCDGGTRSRQNCTSDSDCPLSICAIQAGIGADLVLGQGSSTTSACDGDGNFQTYPTRPLALASTLCTIPEDQVSILEGGSSANMAVDDAGNLYVPDWDNHRILRYDSPFATDTVADYVWGQTDFTGNHCNQGRGLGAPDAGSLCFRNPENVGFTAGVAIDGSGNLWATDSRNNRVLRFSKNPKTGVPGSIADLVLGQPDFGSSSNGLALNQMWAPAAVRVDASGTVYVADSQPGGGSDLGGRILIFRPPYSNGMFANFALGANQLQCPTGLELEPSGGLWVSDTANNQLLLYRDGVVRKVLFKDVPNYGVACGGDYHGDGRPLCFPYGDCYDSSNVCQSFGGIGVDDDGNVIAAASYSYQDVWHFRAPFPDPNPGVAHSADASLFLPYFLGEQNQTGGEGLNSPRGVAVAAAPQSAPQLIVADPARILFWDDPPNFNNGQRASGVVGAPDFRSQDFSKSFGRIRADGAGHLWAIRDDKIVCYTLPLRTGANPMLEIASGLPALGTTGSITWDFFLVDGGIAPTPDGRYVWVADSRRHRVFRIRDPLTNPIVDVVLGQRDAAGTDCNQGQTSPSRNSLCYPGAVALDPQGNVYVSDASTELAGNFRMLEFDASLFPDSPASAIFGPDASRVFGTAGRFTIPGCQDPLADPLCAPWEPAFDSAGHMVVGMNGYIGGRFPLVYDAPLTRGTPDAALFDYSSMAYAATFDSDDNLYIVDLDRSHLLIYFRPFAQR